MAVNGINHAHPTQTQNVHAQLTQKAQGGAAKATTANGTATAPHAAETHATLAAAVVENNAGREQGTRQNTGNHAGGTTGTHLNTYA
jgi:hypothetical protein